MWQPRLWLLTRSFLSLLNDDLFNVQVDPMFPCGFPISDGEVRLRLVELVLAHPASLQVLVKERLRVVVPERTRHVALNQST